MIKVKELNELEIPKYAPVFQCVYDLFGDYTGVFFKIEIEGQDRLLQRLDNLCVIYTLKDKNVVSYEMFAMDSEYNVISAGFDDYEMNIIDDTLTVHERDSKVIQSLSFFKRRDGVDNDGYNGVIIYVQYNKDTKNRLTLYYQQMYNKSEEILYYTLDKLPLQVHFEYSLKPDKNNVFHSKKEERYIESFVDEDSLFYSALAIKEYGLSEYLKNRSILLQKEDMIIRYFKILKTTKDNQVLVSFPFTKHYTAKEMSSLIESMGFNSKIPLYLFNVFNGYDEILRNYKKVAEFLREYEMTPPDEVVRLTLKFGEEQYSDGSN